MFQRRQSMRGYVPHIYTKESNVRGAAPGQKCLYTAFFAWLYLQARFFFIFLQWNLKSEAEQVSQCIHIHAKQILTFNLHSFLGDAATKKEFLGNMWLTSLS